MNEDQRFDLEIENEFSKLLTCQMEEYYSNTFYDTMQGSWVEGLRNSLLSFKEDITSGKQVGKQEQYVIAVIQAWHALAKEIGSPTIIEAYEKKPLPIEQLL